MGKNLYLLVKQIPQLKKELKRERSAVDFYANSENWKDNNLLGVNPSIVDEDTIFENESVESNHITIGGKLARQTQKERKVNL